MASIPRISIVTPSFNQASYLEEAIQSVLAQRYPALEYIVIDGGSNDGSQDIIHRHADKLAYWRSEPDRGQVHAINEGLERATGELFAFLNSDDLLLPGALWSVAKAFASTKRTWICGDTLLFGEGQALDFRPSVVPRGPGHALAWAYRAAQPAMFWRRRILGSGFDETWRYDFDHDLYVRLLIAGHECVHIPAPLAAYRLHPASKTVAEPDRFEEEFDRIAQRYEPLVGARDRRWSRATRTLRRSFAAAALGDRGAAARHLFTAACTYPPAMLDRPFWGCLRRLVGTRGIR
jgi:glycosyltransferase involved in cell wall biosynthesis